MNKYNHKGHLINIICDNCKEPFSIEQLYNRFYDIFSGFLVVDTVSLEAKHICRKCMEFINEKNENRY